MLAYTSKVAWQPREMSSCLPFDKKETLDGNILIQGHIEMRFELRFLSSGFFLQHAITKHGKLSFSTPPHPPKIDVYCVFVVLVCTRNAGREFTC